MTVKFNAKGKPDAGAKNFLALTETCKQIREESAEYVVSVEDFLLTPRMKFSKFGNRVIAKPFDLNRWLNSASKLPKIQPRVVTLHLGHLDFAELRDSWEWTELRHMFDCIPRPTVRSDVPCDFYVTISVFEEVVGMMRFSFQLQERGEYLKHIDSMGRASIRSTISRHKETLKAATSQALEMLTPAEVVRKQRCSYGNLGAVEWKMISMPLWLNDACMEARSLRARMDIDMKYGSFDEYCRLIDEGLIE